MPKTVTMTVRLPIELKEQLDALSLATDRSRAYLAAQAIEEYLETQRWQIEAILEGIRAADRGELVDLGDVKRRWEYRHAHPADPTNR